MRRFNISNARHGAAITVKVVPRARKTELAGVMADGTLKIRLAAPPVEGAANEALVEFLSAALGIPTSQIDIVAGERSERKLISLLGISPDAVNTIVRGLLPPAGESDLDS